jgi:hypothetical protein
MDQGLAQLSYDEVPLITVGYRQLLAQRGFRRPSGFYIHPTELTAQASQQHGIISTYPTKIHVPEIAYGLEQIHILPILQATFYVASLSSSPHKQLQTQLVLKQQQQTPEQQYQQQQSSAHKMSHASSTHYHSETRQMHALGSRHGVRGPIAVILNSQNIPLHPQAYTNSSDPSLTHWESGHPELLAQTHHHHRLPDRPPPLTLCSTEHGHEIYTAKGCSSWSVIGQPGMPEPAAKPRGRKLKFHQRMTPCSLS